MNGVLSTDISEQKEKPTNENLKPENEDVVIVDDDDDAIIEESEEYEENDSKKEEIPEEAKGLIRDNMRNKTKKRIIGLVKDVTDLKKSLEDKDRKIEELINAEKRRTYKETEVELNSKLNDIKEKRKSAYESGDYDKLNELDIELMRIGQQAPVIKRQENINPDEYFGSKNPWYRNKGIDIDLKKTRYAIGLSNDIEHDPQYAHLTATQKLDEVAKMTNDAFKSNPYRRSAPTDGITTERQNKDDVVITRDHIEEVKLMYPGKERSFYIKKAKELLKEESI